MIYESLDFLHQLSGFLSSLMLILIVFIAIIILKKSISLNDKIYYAFVLFILFINSPWVPSAFGYVYWLITHEFFHINLYIFLGTLGIPLIVLSWFYIYTTLTIPDWKKKILSIYGVYSIAFYIYIFYFLSVNPDLVPIFVGNLKTPLDIEYKGFVLIFISTSLIITVPAFLHFCLISIRNEKNPHIKWRGKFLLIAVVCFSFGATVDALIEINIFFLLITRIMLFIATITFYLGMIMPNWIRIFLGIKLQGEL